MNTVYNSYRIRNEVLHKARELLEYILGTDARRRPTAGVIGAVKTGAIIVADLLSHGDGGNEEQLKNGLGT